MMQSSTYCRSLLAPTLLALAVHLSLAAQDAPVIVGAVDDPLLTSNTINAVANSPGATFRLGDAVFTSKMNSYDPVNGNTPFSAGYGTVNGIAITQISGNGTWQYSEDLGVNWINVAAANIPSEESVTVIPLSFWGSDFASETSYNYVTLLQYVPNSNAPNEDARLTFRAIVDVSAVNPSLPISTVNPDFLPAIVYGDTPTVFSATTLTVHVPVIGVNDAPIWNASFYNYYQEGSSIDFSTAFVAGGGAPLQISVSDLLGYTDGTDAESGTNLGILLTGLSHMSANHVTLRRYNGANATWTNIVFSEDDAIHLGPNDSIEVTPIPGSSSKGARLLPFQFHLWDQSSAVPGDTSSPSNSSYGGTSPYSVGYGQVTVTLVNTPPVVNAASWDMVFNPGETSASLAVTATDDDVVTQLGFTLYNEGEYTDASPLTIAGVDFMWGTPPSAPVSPWTNTVLATGLEGKLGNVVSFDVSATDSDNARSNSQLVNVYGNSNPFWEATSITEAVALNTESTTQNFSATFILRDVDVENQFATWRDALSIPMPTGLRGVLTIAQTPPVFPPNEQRSQSQQGAIQLVSQAYTSVTITYIPDSTATSDYFESFGLVATDRNGLVTTLPVTIAVSAPHHSPVITAPMSPASLGTLLGGTTATVTAQATDIDGGELSWSVLQPAHGVVTPATINGPQVSFVYTPTTGYSGPDSFTLRVADPDLLVAEVTVSANVEANTPPILVSTFGDGGNGNEGQGPISVLAISGQSFLALITGGDKETPTNVRITINGTTPAGIAFTSTGSGLGSLQGIPTTPGIYNFSLSLDDGVNVTTQQISMTVVAPILANVPPPLIPASGPGNTVYGAFSPGSAANFQAVADILAGRANTESRAFWWDGVAGAYAELPVLPTSESRVWHAIWLASVTPVTLPAQIPAVALPYAMDLVPGWTFFGLPPVTDGTTVSGTHSWANCSLQSTNGVSLSVTERAAILGNADIGGPWAWDGTSYARTTTLRTGSGYWLYNRGSQVVRLVRGAGSALSVTSVANRSATQDEQPPLPPNGTTAASSESGGSCGSGSGMGLLTLGMTLFFLRFRRS